MQIFIQIAKQQYKVEQEQRAILADAKLYVNENILLKEIAIGDSDVPFAQSVCDDKSETFIRWFIYYHPFTTPTTKEFRKSNIFIFQGAPKEVIKDFLKYFENSFRFAINHKKKFDCNMLNGGMFYLLKYCSIYLYAVLCDFTLQQT